MCNSPPHRVLGMCHSFYLRPFAVPTPPTPPAPPTPKTLMFFDGCATHLGCTVILRGALNRELKKVKRVMYFMIFALFNWRLERSFLMDEFASVPAFSDRQSGSSEEGLAASPTGSEKERTGAGSSSSTPPPPFLVAKEADEVVDESDPLCAFLRRGSGAVDPPSPPLESSGRDPSFEVALEGTILSISPHIRYAIPYLESDEGSHSPLRKFFPQKLYFSSLLRSCESPQKGVIVSSPSEGPSSDKAPKAPNGSVVFKPCHHFITTKITKGSGDSGFRSAVADFRARGGVIQRVCRCQSGGEKELKKMSESESVERFGFYPKKQRSNHY